MDDSATDTIKRFVAGDITPLEFRDRLYSDPTFESVLSRDPTLSASNYVFSSGGTYYFVIEQDYDDPGGVLNAQGALCDFMDRNSISYSRADAYSEFYELILDAQPRWLQVDSKYVATQILPGAGERSGPQLVEWLEAEFLKRFRYVGAPPSWIQSPEWPINENGPLVFLGQLDVANYFHDAASVYIFHDPKTGCCATIIQVF